MQSSYNSNITATAKQHKMQRKICAVELATFTAKRRANYYVKAYGYSKVEAAKLAAMQHVTKKTKKQLAKRERSLLAAGWVKQQQAGMWQHAAHSGAAVCTMHAESIQAGGEGYTLGQTLEEWEAQ